MSKKSLLKKLNIRKVLVEMLSVIFAVLLALILNEWRNNFNQKKLLAKARQNLQEELVFNRNELNTKINHHQIQLRQLEQLEDSLQGFDRPFYSYDMGVAVLNIKKAAWESVTLTDVVNQLSFSELSSFSEMYRGFELIEKLQDNYLREAFSLNYNKAENSGQAFHLTKSHLRQMIAWERELLQEVKSKIGLKEK